MRKLLQVFRSADADRKASTAPLKIEREHDTIELDIAEFDMVPGGASKPTNTGDIW